MKVIKLRNVTIKKERDQDKGKANNITHADVLIIDAKGMYSVS